MQLPLWASTEISVRISHFSGLYDCGLLEKPALSPHSTLSFTVSSDGVTPFCLSLSPHKDTKLCQRNEQQSLQPYRQYFPVPQCLRRAVFHFHMQNQRHLSLFSMLGCTFAFCLAALTVKSFLFTFSSSKMFPQF